MRVFAIAILLITTSASHACDVCGCSLGAGYFGILPQFNKSFVGLRFAHNRFSARIHHEGSQLPVEFSSDRYTTAELWGGLYLSPNLQVIGFLPYQYNTMDGNIQVADVAGIGDASVMVQYIAFNTSNNIEKKIRQTVRFGGGLKLPTGKSDEQVSGVLLNRNFQPGTGSFDFMVNGIYTAVYGKTGVNIETGWKINTSDKGGYRFGNQFNTGASLFYRYSGRNPMIAVLPNAGIYYEQAAVHKDGIVEQLNTGGSASFFSYGTEVYVYSFAFGINVKHPLSQGLNTENGVQLESGDRVRMHVTIGI